MPTRLCVLIIGGALLLGGYKDADVAGEYTVAITNGSNGCGFTNWTEGDTSTGIPFSVTQDGERLTGTVGGSSGLFLDLWLGDRVYTGTVSGNNVELTLYGTTTNTSGNCTYTVNSTIDGEIDGDVLVGDIRYRAATNGNPDCQTIEGCVSRQSFNGTRPPQ